MNDGSWNVPQQLGEGNTSLPGAKFELTLYTDCRHHGTECGFVHVGAFGSEAGGVSVILDANMVATQRARKSGVQLLELIDAMRGLAPELHQGRWPALMPIYGTTFGAYTHKHGSGPGWPGEVKGPVDWWGWKRTDPEWVAALDEWKRIFPMNFGNATETWGRIDWDIGQSNEGDFTLESANASVHQLLAEGIDPHAVLIGNLGDEIHLLRPEQRVPLNETDALFHAWATSTHELTPARLGCASWADCHYLPFDPQSPQSQNGSRGNPRLYYYSNLWAHDWGIARIKNATQLAQQLLPAARMGANLPCMCESDEWGGYVLKDGQVHTNSYMGLTYTYVRSFREGALTLPWAEDWVFGPPVGTQQMTALLMDVFRSAVRDHARPPVAIGLGRIVALYHHSSTPDSLTCIFGTSMSEATVRPNPRWRRPTRTPPRACGVARRRS